jgi:hypothetical protein
MLSGARPEPIKERRAAGRGGRLGASWGVSRAPGYAKTTSCAQASFYQRRVQGWSALLIPFTKEGMHPILVVPLRSPCRPNADDQSAAAVHPAWRYVDDALSLPRFGGEECYYILRYLHSSSHRGSATNAPSRNNPRQRRLEDGTVHVGWGRRVTSTLIRY